MHKFAGMKHAHADDAQFVFVVCVCVWVCGCVCVCKNFILIFILSGIFRAVSAREKRLGINAR